MAQQTLTSEGCFIIESYNQSKPFSSFFPGVAGLWGIPMWAFYVNRGQCIASFGIESKDKAILEFQPANKSYRTAALNGFRTFIKLKGSGGASYWEPFQEHLEGTHFRNKQTMRVSAHDLTIKDVNADLGLTASVNYFTLAQEPYAALVRRLTITNTSARTYAVDLIDGLPAMIPYGLTDHLNKNISRTVEAWVKVSHIAQKSPYYQLFVEVSDKPQVTHIRDGNFFFSFNPQAKGAGLLDPIVESACVFGDAHDFTAPEQFYKKSFKVPRRQQTANRTPSAMGHAQFILRPKAAQQIISLYGYAKNEVQLAKIVRQASQKRFIDKKADANKAVVDGIKKYTHTVSASPAFDQYSSNTFLDNILRGGLPITIQSGSGPVALNVYSRKHGDLERDYNYFYVAPTFYSQGNGNYRDVNQNRRNDVWFNEDVKSGHVVNFLNLVQADGYNPLIVKGMTFSVHDRKALDSFLGDCIGRKDRPAIMAFSWDNFMPGDLFNYLAQKEILLKVDAGTFLDKVLAVCRKQELAEHGEGFWADHWTYNLDLIESYLSVYPEGLHNLLLGNRDFHFYRNAYYVLPRERRYILTDRGVRQYGSVGHDAEHKAGLLRTKNGKGGVYQTHLICKLLCLIANKAATFDPSGIGIEMEADKPNWYDALNGLPGLLGSSISETIELKRLSRFLLDAMDKLSGSADQRISIFAELAEFITGLRGILPLKTSVQVYWDKANDLKERYRAKTYKWIDGKETEISTGFIRHFLKDVIGRADQGIRLAKTPQGFLATYFYHDVVRYKILEKTGAAHTVYVRPLRFKRRALPLFLEGYVHALRVQQDTTQARRLYRQVRSSDLFDRTLRMYRVNADLSGESEEIGRARIFPPGWLENGSIWLHMEYKFMLELLRCGLYDEYYQNFKNVLIPFIDPQRYGRSILENSSFLVSSAHEDASLHGRGFVARLSGSTAEFIHMWLLMNLGRRPFILDDKGGLNFVLRPALASGMFTVKKTLTSYLDRNNRLKEVELPINSYAFNLFGATLVVYHNPRRRNTYGAGASTVEKIHLVYPNQTIPVVVLSAVVSGQYAKDIRDRKVERIDAFFG